MNDDSWRYNTELDDAARDATADCAPDWENAGYSPDHDDEDDYPWGAQ